MSNLRYDPVTGKLVSSSAGVSAQEEISRTIRASASNQVGLLAIPQRSWAQIKKLIRIMMFVGLVFALGWLYVEVYDSGANSLFADPGDWPQHILFVLKVIGVFALIGLLLGVNLVFWGRSVVVMLRMSMLLFVSILTLVMLVASFILAYTIVLSV